MPSVSKATNDDLIGCCASRIINMANEVNRTHEMGMPHGDHNEPWTLEFHQVVVSIYLQTVPTRYARGVAQSFKRCVTLMDTIEYPANETADWLIVQAYASSVTEAVCGHLHLGPEILEAGAGQRLEPTTPGLFPYAEIAPLVSPAGIDRLLRASRVVQTACNRTRSGTRPPEVDIELLRMLAAGKPIVDIATECECSRRTMHRRFNQMWVRLGVADAREAILVGGRDGWL